MDALLRLFKSKKRRIQHVYTYAYACTHAYAYAYLMHESPYELFHQQHRKVLTCACMHVAERLSLREKNLAAKKGEGDEKDREQIRAIMFRDLDKYRESEI